MSVDFGYPLASALASGSNQSQSIAPAGHNKLQSPPTVLALNPGKGVGDQATASRNLSLLNTALTAGGFVQLMSGLGTVYVNGTVILPSGTELNIGAGTRLKMLNPGTNVPMLVNKNWQSTSVTVSSGITDGPNTPFLQGLRLATANCGTNAHGKQVGDYILLKGDTTNRYIGIWRVENVLDAFRLQFLIPGPNAGIGASAGTVTMDAADFNIAVTGAGQLDYNGPGNQTDYGYNCMLAVFNKVRGLRVQGLYLANSPKYCIYWGNLQDSSFSDLVIDGPSAAIQGIGLGLGVSIQRVKGETSDDMIAWTGDNIGFPVFNFSNGNLNGTLSGFDVQDIVCYSTYANVIGLYPTNGANSLLGISIQGVRCLRAPGRYLYIDGDASVTTAGVGNIVITNIVGPAPNDSVVKVGGVIGGMTVRSLTIGCVDLGSTNFTVPVLSTGNNITISRLRGSLEAVLNFDSSGAQRYVFQLSNSSTFPDVALENTTINNATGGSGSYGISGNYAGRDTLVRNCAFFGTSAALSGAPTGGTVFTIENCFFDTFRACDVIGAMTLVFRRNRFRAATLCLFTYGSGFTANIQCYDNDWGSATMWLQIGGAAGETLGLNIWQGNNRANAGIGTSLSFVSTAGTFNLRASDASLQMDGAKWTSIDTGCIIQNNNAAFGGGVGVLIKGPTTIGRTA